MLEEITDALRALQDEIPGLQVSAYWIDNPSPPCIDFYPATLFQEGAALPAGQNLVHFVVRARVAMADPVAGQQLLYRLLDPMDAASVELALAEADCVVGPEGVAGFTQYADDANSNERLLGCEWRVSRFL